MNSRLLLLFIVTACLLSAAGFVFVQFLLETSPHETWTEPALRGPPARDDTEHSSSQNKHRQIGTRAPKPRPHPPARKPAPSAADNTGPGDRPAGQRFLGRVLDGTTGQPLRRFRVFLKPLSAPLPPSAESWAKGRDCNDQEGRFRSQERFLNKQELYRLKIQAPGRLPLLIKRWRPPPPPADFVARLYLQATLTGQVRLAGANKAPTGVGVRWLAARPQRHADLPAVVVDVSRDGSFKARVPAEVPGYLEASGPSRLVVRKGPFNPAPGSLVDAGRFLLRQGARLRVQVVGEREQPLAGIAVRASIQPSVPPAAAPTKLEVRTDAQGQADFGEVPSGHLLLELTTPQGAITHFQATKLSPGIEHVLRLPLTLPSLQISGSVKTSPPVTGLILLRLFAKKKGGSWSLVGSMESPSAGRYAFKHLAPGSYRLEGVAHLGRKVERGRLLIELTPATGAVNLLIKLDP